MQGPIDQLGELAREPMVVELGGSLFLSGYGSQVTGLDPYSVPLLWRSDDGGASWTLVDVGTKDDGASGNSDRDLAVGPAGTLYFAAMGYDRDTSEGVHISIGASADRGATWNWVRVSEDRYDDRPWVRATPDGTAHAIWNDGQGVSYSTSADRGATWQEQPRIHGEGGSSHMAVGPAGEIAVRITPLSASGNILHEGAELVAVSTDGGSTWAKHAVPGNRVWEGVFSSAEVTPRWVEPIAWDDEGALYLVWGEDSRALLARSQDQGATWETWQVADEGKTAYFPYLIARGDGDLAATWFAGVGNDLELRVAHISLSSSAGEPTVRLAPKVVPDSWLFGDEPVRNSAGEYAPVLFLENGGIGVATPIQNPADDRWGFSWWTAQP